jgi:MFS family permease
VSTTNPSRKSALDWRMVVLAGCCIAVISFGPRSAMGVFQMPVLTSFGWGSAAFSVALAIQNLLWGTFQPFAGALADRYGSLRVLMVGALFYAAGLILMAWSSTPLAFDLTAGALIGIGLSGSSFNLVLGAFGKLVPPEKQPMAFGLGSAAGSFGQFLFSPLAGGLVAAFGWQTTVILFGCVILAIIPLSLAVASPPAPVATEAHGGQSSLSALRAAMSDRSYVLLTLGFYTCGFQLAFVTVHFQKYVIESGLPASTGYWAFALVGMFNVVGSLSAGWLSQRMPRRYILSAIYLARSASTVLFILLPPSTAGVYLFGMITGLLWLSTVPPTNSIIVQLFGARHFAMLSGFAFFSHQVGGFCGVLIGGYAREMFGSYTIAWAISIALGVFSALVNLPIVERPARGTVEATA